MFLVCSNHLHIFTFFEFWFLVGTPTNGVTKLPALRLKRQDHDAEQRSPLRAAQLFSGPSAWWAPFNSVEGYRDMLRLRMEDIWNYETLWKYENIDLARQSMAIYRNPWQSAMWVNGIFSTNSNWWYDMASKARDLAASEADKGTLDTCCWPTHDIGIFRYSDSHKMRC